MSHSTLHNGNKSPKTSFNIAEKTDLTYLAIEIGNKRLTSVYLTENKLTTHCMSKQQQLRS